MFCWRARGIYSYMWRLVSYKHVIVSEHHHHVVVRFVIQCVPLNKSRTFTLSLTFAWRRHSSLINAVFTLDKLEKRSSCRNSRRPILYTQCWRISVIVGVEICSEIIIIIKIHMATFPRNLFNGAYKSLLKRYFNKSPYNNKKGSQCMILKWISV